jgi:hypothetical protein
MVGTAYVPEPEPLTFHNEGRVLNARQLCQPYSAFFLSS